MFSRGFVVLGVAGLFLTGCASGTFKARQAEREKLVGSSGLYCEFVNGEQHPDIDVELNMQMAKRCDVAKPFTITNYKTSSEMNGIMYCCQVPGGTKVRASAPKPPKPAPAAKSEPKEKESAPDKTPSPVIESNDEVISD